MSALREIYRRDGFAACGRIFDDESFAAIRARIEELLEGDTERMLNWHVRVPWLLELALRAEIVDRVAELLGPDIALFNTRILCKPPHGERDVGWHQDVPYWPLEPPVVTTFWLAVDEATEANGAMRMLPGAHRAGALEHAPATNDVFGEAIPARLIDESRAVRMTLAAGECSFHDGFVPHASPPNRTARRRCAFIARYLPTSARLDRSRRELYGHDYPLYWVRGDPGRNRYVNR
jgi:ectoine hydroxylase-related dioxygenase (phytanoyl-CoA dioxygenase family)